jgi:hypothetical protein
MISCPGLDQVVMRIEVVKGVFPILPFNYLVKFNMVYKKQTSLCVIWYKAAGI